MRSVIYNCKIWTDDGFKDWMIFNSNKIEDIGTGSFPEVDNKIDLEQGFVFPGLIDSHIHVYGIGRMSYRLNLKKPGSIVELQNRLEEYATNNPNLEWIVGHDWDQDYMEDGHYPDKSDLDLVIKDKPVLLFRSGNHNGVVNSKALEILGIDMNSENPIGGVIEKDSNGEPTGILRETALSLVTDQIKITDYETRKQIVQTGLQKCLEIGLTMVQTNDPDCWKIYKDLDENHELPIRVAFTFFYEELGTNKVPRSNTNLNLLSCDRVKIFTDGSLGGHTAALKDRYSDENTLGVTIHAQDQLNKMVSKVNKAGYRLEIHAIGDLAAEHTLDSFENANLTPNDRPILTHAQVLNKNLMDRLAKNGVIANIQPQFVTTDSQWVEERLGLGTRRLKYAYAWKTMLNSDIRIAGGSDAPIEDPNPLLGLYAAIFRKSSKNTTWKPTECLTFNEALDLYTKGSAFAARRENDLGQLKPGYLVDFIVLDKNIALEPEKLTETEVLQVWVDGERNYSK